jgi:hypothetical protein
MILLCTSVCILSSCRKEVSNAATTLIDSNSQTSKDINFEGIVPGTTVPYDPYGFRNLSALFSDSKDRKILYIGKLVYRINHSEGVHPTFLQVVIPDYDIYASAELTDTTTIIVLEPARFPSIPYYSNKHEVDVQLLATGPFDGWIRPDLIGAEIYFSPNGGKPATVTGLPVEGVTLRFED